MSRHKSRLKEKLAQAQRHAFLLRADNKSALVGIIDSVRELANNGEEGSDGKISQRNGPSPLERDRFMAWAADVEKLLFEFEPSENHTNDPLLRVLEHLQFLQDGHMCLAEVAMDARAVLECWDRSGVFDSETSSEDDDDDNDEMNERFPGAGFLPSDPAKESLRRLEQSYAYQNVRQRAAASIIKRNVLTWVRSKASFCERVAEIEIFGRTTEALLKELSLTSATLAKANGGMDIFALATGRRDPKSRYSGSIAFKDLLQFSKHMALFPVDQALRTVEDVTRRRYLFDSRCAMKIQVVWRRVRESVRARRLRRVMEDLRLQREQEAQAKREAAKEAKKRKASEAGKRKVTKAIKRSSTARPSVISSAISRLNATSTPVDEDIKTSPKELSPAGTNEKRKPSSPPVPLSDTANQRASTRNNTTSSLDDKLKPPASTPRSRHRASRVTAANNNDSDDDTTDVEAAWKSFMDTVAADMSVQEAPSENEVQVDEPASDPMHLATLPPMEDTWESWSDDENKIDNNENLVTSPLTYANPTTPSTSTSPTPRIKVVVSVNKNSSSAVTARRLPRKETMTPRRNQTRPPTNPSTSGIRPQSSLPFDATLQNHTGPYTGAGQLSLMAPFVDADRSKKSQPSVVPERKHLYELDLNGTDRKDASFVHVARAFASYHDPEEQEIPLRPKTPDKLAILAETPRTSSRRTTVERLRSITGDQEESARVRNLLNPENQDKDPWTSPHGDSNSNQPSYFIYGTHGKTR